MLSIGQLETKSGTFDLMKLSMSVVSLLVVSVLLIIMAVLPIDPMWTYIVGMIIVAIYVYYTVASMLLSIRRNVPTLTV